MDLLLPHRQCKQKKGDRRILVNGQGNSSRTHIQDAYKAYRKLFIFFSPKDSARMFVFLELAAPWHMGILPFKQYIETNSVSDYAPE